MDRLQKETGISRNTMNKYLEYLEAAFLIRLVHRTDLGAKLLQRSNTDKVYLTNPSLRTALFAPVGAEDQAMGPLAETALVAQAFHGGLETYYARWKDGEVDFVRMDRTGKAVQAMEIKWSDRFVDAPDQLGGLIRFAQRNGLAEVQATTRTRTAERAVAGVRITMQPTALEAWTIGDRMLGDSL